MLRPEDRGQLDPRIVAEDLGGVADAAVDRCRVGDEGDARAGEQRAIFVEEALDADPDGAGGGRGR